jgi:hypothetical protein
MKPDESLPRLEGLTFEAFTFRRNKVSAQMSLFFAPRPSPVGDDKASTEPPLIRYRSVKFNVLRRQADETPERLAWELVQYGLIHPLDEAAAAAWLTMSLGHLIAAPYAYTRAMLPAELREVASTAPPPSPIAHQPSPASAPASAPAAQLSGGVGAQAVPAAHSQAQLPENMSEMRQDTAAVPVAGRPLTLHDPVSSPTPQDTAQSQAAQAAAAEAVMSAAAYAEAVPDASAAAASAAEQPGDEAPAQEHSTG